MANFGDCADCGTTLEKGRICPNCHEELYIYETQSGDIDFELSQEFIDKAEEQRDEIKRQHEAGKP